MNDLVKQIEQADEIELNDCIFAVIRRYKALHIERELVVLSLPTDPKTRDIELKDGIRFIRSCYRQEDALSGEQCSPAGN